MHPPRNAIDVLDFRHREKNLMICVACNHPATFPFPVAFNLKFFDVAHPDYQDVGRLNYFDVGRSESLHDCSWIDWIRDGVNDSAWLTMNACAQS